MFTSVTKIAFSIVVPLSFAISTAWAAPKSAKVGVILPLSGEFAILGEACKNGAQLAASELKNEGVALDLLIQDSPSCRATATLSAYQKLRSSDNVQVFFGFVSPEEIAAVGPLVERDGTALVGFTSPKASPKNSLMVWMSPEVEAQRLAVEVYRRHRDVAILSADQQWERDVSDAFSAEYTKLGGRISLRVEAPFTSKDLRAEVLKVRRTTATAVVIPPYSLFSSYAKALRRTGSRLPIYGIELDQAAIDDSQGGAEGALVIRPADPDGAFGRRYSLHFHGRSAEIPAPQCYDGIRILGEAVKSGAMTGSEFGRYFTELKRFSGVSGPIVFEAGRTIFNTEFVVVSKGKLTSWLGAV